MESATPEPADPNLVGLARVTATFNPADAEKRVTFSTDKAVEFTTEIGTVTFKLEVKTALEVRFPSNPIQWVEEVGKDVFRPIDPPERGHGQPQRRPRHGQDHGPAGRHDVSLLRHRPERGWKVLRVRSDDRHHAAPRVGSALEVEAVEPGKGKPAPVVAGGPRPPGMEPPEAASPTTASTTTPRRPPADSPVRRGALLDGVHRLVAPSQMGQGLSADRLGLQKVGTGSRTARSITFR